MTILLVPSSENVFISHSFLRIVSPDREFMVDISSLPSLGKCYATSFWSPWIQMRNLSPFPLISSYCLSLADFQMISLSLGFRSLIMIYFGLSYLRFAQPWISRFMSFPKSGKFLTITYLNTLSASCSPFGLFSFLQDFNDGNIVFFLWFHRSLRLC